MHKCWQTHLYKHTFTQTQIHTYVCMFVDCLCNFAVSFDVCFVTLQLITPTVYACVARQETFGVAMPPPISSSQICFCFFFSMVHKKLMRKRLLLSCGIHACTHGTHCTQHLFALRVANSIRFHCGTRLCCFLRPF